LKKYSYLAIATIVVFASVISIKALAQEEIPAKTKPLQDFEKAGGIVDYMGETYGLHGWFIIDANKKTQSAYTTKDGATLMGSLFAPNGESETINQLKNLKIKRSGSQQSTEEVSSNSTDPSEIIYNKFFNAGWIHIGDISAPYFYAIININSKECKTMLDKMQEFIDSQKVSIRLIPIAISEDDFYKTAQIFSTENPAEAIVKYINGQEITLPNKEEINSNALTAIDKNAILAKEIAIKGIPLIVYKRPTDSQISVISGVPENALLLASEIQVPITAPTAAIPPTTNSTKVEEKK